MKTLKSLIHESLNENKSFKDSKTKVAAEKVISKLRIFLSKIIDLRHSELFGSNFDRFADHIDTLEQLCQSAIENIEFSMVGAMNEDADDVMPTDELIEIAKNIAQFRKVANALLEAIKQLTKTELTIEIQDAKVDIQDILSELNSFDETINELKKLNTKEQ